MNKVRKFVSYVMYVESGLTFVVLSVNVFFLAANESGPNSEVTVIMMMLSSAPRFAVPFFYCFSTTFRVIYLSSLYL